MCGWAVNSGPIPLCSDCHSPALPTTELPFLLSGCPFTLPTSCLLAPCPSLFLLLSWIDEESKAGKNCAQSVLTRVFHLVSLLERPCGLNLGACLLFSPFNPLEHALLQHGANGFLRQTTDVGCPSVYVLHLLVDE